MPSDDDFETFESTSDFKKLLPEVEDPEYVTFINPIFVYKFDCLYYCYRNPNSYLTIYKINQSELIT